jgi:hypothetical protein
LSRQPRRIQENMVAAAGTPCQRRRQRLPVVRWGDRKAAQSNGRDGEREKGKNGKAMGWTRRREEWLPEWTGPLYVWAFEQPI